MSTPKIKFFLDAEFIEDGVTIDLISLAVVCETGETFYAISNEFDPNKASDWVKENVIKKLESPATHPQLWMSKAGIRKKLLEFIDDQLRSTGPGSNPNEQLFKPEFWGYYADYDWVVLCQLFGTMMQLPKGWPMYCRDIKQLCDDLGNPELPTQAEGEHNAIADAKWNWEAYTFLADIQARLANKDEEIIRLEDEIVRWQEATGLEVGGDPGGVEPHHLVKFIRELTEQIESARGTPTPAKSLAEFCALDRSLISALDLAKTFETAARTNTFDLLDIPRIVASLKALVALEQKTPYDCYWSRRALAAENALRGSDDLIKAAQVILTDTLVPDGYNEQEAVEKLVALMDGPAQHAVQAETNKVLRGSNPTGTAVDSEVRGVTAREICATEVSATAIQNDHEFGNNLLELLNKFSMENASDSPDFVLCGFLMRCLKAFNAATVERDGWYGRTPIDPHSLGTMWRVSQSPPNVVVTQHISEGIAPTPPLNEPKPRTETAAANS